MKSKTITLALMAAAVLLTGCWQKSVYPFYKAKDVFFEEKLIGSWGEPDKSGDDDTTWTFAKSELPNVYNVSIADKENKVECDGRLFKIGATQFLDLHSRNRGVVDIPGHVLFRVKVLGESVKMQMLSPDWIKNRLQLHPNEIANMPAVDPEHPEDADKGEFILTADTERLQKYVTEHLNDEGFFEEPFELKKVK